MRAAPGWERYFPFIPPFFSFPLLSCPFGKGLATRSRRAKPFLSKPLKLRMKLELVISSVFSLFFLFPFFSMAKPLFAFFPHRQLKKNSFSFSPSSFFSPLFPLLCGAE